MIVITSGNKVVDRDTIRSRTRTTNSTGGNKRMCVSVIEVGVCGKM